MVCSEYGWTIDQALDYPISLLQSLVNASLERKHLELDNLAIANANQIGLMLFGKDGGKSVADGIKRGISGGAGGGGKPKTAWWSGGRTTKKPDLRPNPSRPRLKELAEMEPRPLDPFAIQKMLEIQQSPR